MIPNATIVTHQFDSSKNLSQIQAKYSHTVVLGQFWVAVGCYLPEKQHSKLFPDPKKVRTAADEWIHGVSKDRK